MRVQEKGERIVTDTHAPHFHTERRSSTYRAAVARARVYESKLTVGELYNNFYDTCGIKLEPRSCVTAASRTLARARSNLDPADAGLQPQLLHGPLRDHEAVAGVVVGHGGGSLTRTVTQERKRVRAAPKLPDRETTFTA